jgi:hypothetical protein
MPRFIPRRQTYGVAEHDRDFKTAAWQAPLRSGGSTMPRIDR